MLFDWLVRLTAPSFIAKSCPYICHYSRIRLFCLSARLNDALCHQKQTRYESFQCYETQYMQLLRYA